MTTTSGIRQVDLAGAPAIPGLRSRYFADVADYEALAVLFAAANQADQVPWFPTARNVELEMSGGDGADPVNDIVLVEVDGRLVAGTGVERLLRDGGPTYDIWGAIDPAYRRRGRWHRAPALDDGPRACPGITRGPPHGRPRGAARTRRPAIALLAGPGSRRSPLLPDARTGLDDVPRSPRQGLEIRPSPRTVAHDLQRRERSASAIAGAIARWATRTSDGP